MSTVIADTYNFSNLVDWELFYLGHRSEIDAKDTRWLNKHITITDNGKFYKIMKRKSAPTYTRKLYLKPIIKIDPKETTADLTLHTLNLIITKLQDIEDAVSRRKQPGSSPPISQFNKESETGNNFYDRNTETPDRSEQTNSTPSIPNKSVIERVKEIETPK